MANNSQWDLVIYIVMSLIFVVPVWMIFKKAGKNPALSLFIFVPGVGMLIAGVLLAFSRWPATEPFKE